MLLIQIPRTPIYGINNLVILIGQFLHENWSIKNEISVFLELFSQFFSTLLWPDPRATMLKQGYIDLFGAKNSDIAMARAKRHYMKFSSQNEKRF